MAKEERLKEIEKVRIKLSAFKEHLEGTYGEKDANVMLKIIEQTVEMYNNYFEKLDFELQIAQANAVHLLLLELTKRRVENDKV